MRENLKSGSMRGGWRGGNSPDQSPTLLPSPSTKLPWGGPGVGLSPQLTAFFTSAPILASSVAVNFVRA